jgi:UDP-N-acetylglucosamine 2-epimerase (non-hydrolysing)
MKASLFEVVLTDSGGIQEETTILGTPCLTLRPTTERPITAEVGTNRITGSVPERIVPETERILAGDARRGEVPGL